MKILVTGALGFIGSAFVKYSLEKMNDIRVVGFDKNEDQRAVSRLAEVNGSRKFQMIYGDFCEDISELMEDVEVVFHFGAKTFVDHSVKSPESFVRNNIYGTFNILEEVRKARKRPLLVYISTDEVYGQTEGEAPFTEKSVLNPTNPYSASKASAEMMVMAYGKSYNIEYIITRCENNYGAYQNPQKVLPTYVKYGLLNKPLPVYSPGTHKRKWLYVDDHCRALWELVESGFRGIANIAGGHELQNIELARLVLTELGKKPDMIEMTDTGRIRPFHDKRYHIRSIILDCLGWQPTTNIQEGMHKTIGWFVDNQWWLGI
jgi:dTDP-glucose 4,6-dehydratase